MYPSSVRPATVNRLPAPVTRLPALVTRLPTTITRLLAIASLIAGLVGPTAVVAQIEREEQRSGVDALLIGISAVDEQTVWAAGTGGTWIRTTNGGELWQSGRVPGADSLQFRDVHAVDANTAYLLSIGNGTDSRIYRTDDAGASWHETFRNQDPRGFYDCFDFWTPDRGITIGDEIDLTVSMLETRDGRSWVKVPTTRLPAAQSGEGSFAASGHCVRVGPRGSARVIASNPDHGRLFTTHDYGTTWQVDTLPVTVRAGVGPQSVTFRDSDHGMVLTGGYDSEPDDVGIAVTSDGGRTWSPGGRTPLPSGVWGAVYVPDSQPRTVVAVGPDGIVVSQNDGRDWTVVDSFNYWTVTFASSRVGWAVGRDGRVTKLTLR